MATTTTQQSTYDNGDGNIDATGPKIALPKLSRKYKISFVEKSSGKEFEVSNVIIVLSKHVEDLIQLQEEFASDINDEENDDGNDNTSSVENVKIPVEQDEATIKNMVTYCKLREKNGRSLPIEHPARGSTNTLFDVHDAAFLANIDTQSLMKLMQFSLGLQMDDLTSIISAKVARELRTYGQDQMAAVLNIKVRSDDKMYRAVGKDVSWAINKQ